jgi:hypothetical protein
MQALMSTKLFFAAAAEVPWLRVRAKATRVSTSAARHLVRKKPSMPPFVYVLLFFITRDYAAILEILPQKIIETRPSSQ